MLCRFWCKFLIVHGECNICKCFWCSDILDVNQEKYFLYIFLLMKITHLRCSFIQMIWNKIKIVEIVLWFVDTCWLFNLLLLRWSLLYSHLIKNAHFWDEILWFAVVDETVVWFIASFQQPGIFHGESIV